MTDRRVLAVHEHELNRGVLQPTGDCSTIVRTGSVPMDISSPMDNLAQELWG